MKKLFLAIIAVAAIATFGACNSGETYADQRDRELDSISQFLRNENIKVISESEFKARFAAGTTLTDTAANNNEYVLFESNGIYMQVVEPGTGSYITQGTTKNVYTRFTEYCISTRAKICEASKTISNSIPVNAYFVDELSVTNNSGSFIGSFADTDYSLFALYYNSSSSGSISSTVPSGWLIPFTWIKVGRLVNATDKLAHVRLIIPHTYGSTSASANVYAYYYDMTFQAVR